MDDKVLEFYQNAEIDRERHIEPAVIQRLKANFAQEQLLKEQPLKERQTHQNTFEITKDLFDDDVIAILKSLPKTSKDRQIINGLIRAVYA